MTVLLRDCARLVGVVVLGGAVAACEGGVTENIFDEQRQRESVLTGDGPLSVGSALFGEDESGPTGSGIPVNAFLWRAALDTIDFMPLASADPFGGVIISDWHAPTETPDERFKVNIVVLSQELSADGVRARVFRQTQDPFAGQWVDAAVDDGTNTDLENAILTRARELRIAASGGS